MGRTQSTNDLVTEIREQSDEMNLVGKSDEAILRCVNRGLRFITSQLARNWADMLVVKEIVPATLYSETLGLPIPDDAFEERITLVQMQTPSLPTNIPFRSYSAVSSYQLRNSKSFIPQAAYIQSGHLFLAPAPGGGYPINLFYVRRPDNFVKNIGRINTAPAGQPYVVLDDIDLDQISVEVANRLAYVNVVDGRTGYIKGTLQVQRIDGSKVSFRTTVTRTTVEGRTVLAGNELITTADGTYDILPDDYLCNVVGTCVVQNGEMFSTYLVQYAVGEIGRSLGDTREAIGADIIKQAKSAAEQQKAGRPDIMRVKNRSRIWGGGQPAGYPYSTN